MTYAAWPAGGVVTRPPFHTHCQGDSWLPDHHPGTHRLVKHPQIAPCAQSATTRYTFRFQHAYIKRIQLRQGAQLKALGQTSLTRALERSALAACKPKARCIAPILKLGRRSYSLEHRLAG